MKNLLLTLLSIASSFFVTTVVLNTYFSPDIVAIDGRLRPQKKESNFTPETASNFSEILSDYKKWEIYNTDNIILSTDFIPVNTDGEEIEKKEFLVQLKTGRYIPIKRFEAEYMYQLLELPDDTDKKISKSVKSSARVSYSYYMKEGKILPEFNFTDLNGTSYTSDNTKGKILVIKCWFIHCKVCVQEFPKLNKLYDRYEGNEDVIFLSLAFDNSDKLKKFLARKEFRYPVVPNQKKYMSDDIEVAQYPTHLIINEYGSIEKMVSNVDALILSLDDIMDSSLSDIDVQAN